MLLRLLLAVLGRFQRTSLKVTFSWALSALLRDTEGRHQAISYHFTRVLRRSPCRSMLFLQDQVRSHEDVKHGPQYA